MNKLQLTINIILVAAVATLFVLFFAVKPATCEQATASQSPASEKLAVAYVNVDSIMVGYTFAVHAQETLTDKEERIMLNLNTKARKLQDDMATFQRKLETGSFVSRASAESQQQKLLKRQEDLQNEELRLKQELLLETQKTNQQLRDSIDTFLAIYNAQAGYQIIFSNAASASDNILIAQPAYDITAEVLAGLNARCK